MIEETAAVGVRVERPALRVDHAARGVVFGIDVPQFLDAETIDLRLAITVEPALRLAQLGQKAAQAFGGAGVFPMTFKAPGLIRIVAAGQGHPHVARYDDSSRNTPPT